MTDDKSREALFRGRAQDEEPRVRHTCSLGVGCEEYGICYAEAHGEPDQCGKPGPVGVEANTEVKPTREAGSA